ncbi:MAG: hypothetical protein Q8841_02640, partial [Candidatus Phytoplasma australasiaticum]|nr:hypothetical protein [Candidatus Phytoplasma australasiaticum]
VIKDNMPSLLARYLFKLSKYTNYFYEQEKILTSELELSSKSSGTPYSIAYYVNCDKLYVKHNQFLAGITTRDEPISFKEAVKEPL